MFQLTLFGRFQLTSQVQTIDLDHRPRIQSLLAYLAVHRHAPQRRGDLTHALWPDVAQAQGHNRLRNLLYQLRRALPAWDHLIHIDSRTLHWREEMLTTLDVARYEERLQQAARRQVPYQREQDLINAVALYDGDLFPACSDHWIDGPRTHLHEQQSQALGQLISLMDARGAWDDAQHFIQRLLAHDPLREATYCRAMQAYARRGDMAAVMRTYAQCCDLLARELGVEPDSATRRLYEQLTVAHGARIYAAAENRHRAKPTALIGRDEEWAELHRLWQRTQEGTSKLVVIQGEAGIGKTRLFQEFLDWAQQEQIYMASASCHAVEGMLAFAPVAEWLRTEPFWQSLASLEDEWLTPIARLLPELFSRFRHLSDTTLPQEELQRQHFFTALAVALLEHGQPVLLSVDDLQWCDQETLNWLHFLIRYETSTPLLVLTTLRTDDAAERARCWPLMRELNRHDRLRVIDLTPLSALETTTLAQQILGSDVHPVYAAQLHHETDGNPFFVVETVRARPYSFATSPEVQGREETLSVDQARRLPDKIRTLIEERLSRLSPPAMEVMHVAAVIGRRFDGALLAAVTRRTEEELVQVLEELWAQNIIRAVAHDSFDFVHDKVLAAAYVRMSPVRRRFLHKQMATTLVAHRDVQNDDACIQIAHHFRAAGAPADAADYYQRAVQVAARRYAIESLLSASTIALELLQEIDPHHRDRAGLYKQAALIDERVWSWEMVGDMDAYLHDLARLREIGVLLGDEAIRNRELRFRAAALIRLGRYEEAEATAHAGAASHRAAGAAVEEGICLTIVGRARRELGEYSAAVAAFDEALATLEQANAPVFRVQAYSYLSTTYWLMGDYAEAFHCGQAALTICTQAKMPNRRRFALGDMGAAAAMLGQMDQARQWLQESLRLAESVTDAPQEAFCRGHLGWLALREGDFAAAEQELDAAYTLSRRADTLNYASWLLRGLAETAAAKGNEAQARAHAAHALAIAADNQQAAERRAAQRLLDRLYV